MQLIINVLTDFCMVYLSLFLKRNVPGCIMLRLLVKNNIDKKCRKRRGQKLPFQNVCSSDFWR